MKCNKVGAILPPLPLLGHFTSIYCWWFQFVLLSYVIKCFNWEVCLFFRLTYIKITYQYLTNFIKIGESHQVYREHVRNGRPHTRENTIAFSKNPM